MALTQIVLSAANPRVVLGNAGPGVASKWVLQVTAIVAVGTAAIKGRLTDSGVADAGGVALAYRNVGTNTDVAAGTALSAAGIYEVPADGLDVILEHTGGTSVTVVARPVQR